MMLERKAYIFKLKPDGAQKRKLARNAGCCRFAYNKALDWNEEQYKADKSHKVSYKKFCELLVEWKKELPWLAECDSQALQQSVKDLCRAYVNFFEGRAEKPKHHKKYSSKDAFRYPQRVKLDEAGKQIYLPGIGWVKYRRSRFIEGKIKNVTVMRQADGWHVSVQTEFEPEYFRHDGVSFSLNHRAVCFDTLPAGRQVCMTESLRDALNAYADTLQAIRRLVRHHAETCGKQPEDDGFAEDIASGSRCMALFDRLGRTEEALKATISQHLTSGEQEAVGLDMGCVRFCSLSDGTWFTPADALKKNLKKLAHAQRRLARMVKFSHNWRKQKAKIARLHQRIAAVRLDNIEKVALAVSNNHAMIYREDLNILNMTRSAKGTAEEPGKNVKQKSGLNRTILDQGWGMFFCKLEAKSKARGGRVIKVPPQNTSRTCPHCGHVSAANRPTQALFKCEKCGFSGNADELAARNIMVRGQRMSACGASAESAQKQVNRRRRKPGGGQQQEPAEATVSAS